jgi:alpha-amylase/alpha-mannosidase (GH57 family)
MKYLMIFHANLNYSYLTPDRYEFVIRKSYELILDTMRSHFRDVKFVFEASGYTLDEIAARCPDVLAKLKAAIAEGRCEFMGSPYAHPMLPNIPKEDGLWSIRFSNEAYRRHLGIAPRSFWNPECGWRSHLPELVAAAGYANLIGDFEAYSRSRDAAGRPQRPEILAREHIRKKSFYHFGFKHDLPGTDRAIHFPFNKIRGLRRNKLRLFLRTDRIAQYGVRYFMGMKGYTLEEYLDLIDKYSEQNPGETEGALIVFADDAEYIGSNGWFRLKYENQPDNTFEHAPESKKKLIDLVRACRRRGSFCTFDDACKLPPNASEINFDDDTAWHGSRASTWAETPMARLLRPWQDLVRSKLQKAKLTDSTRRRAWQHLTNSYNSDGQWPPTLPSTPHIVHPFNYDYCFQNLLQAELLVGGVDRSKLKTDPVAAIAEVLSPQQGRILQKAKRLLKLGTKRQRDDAALAISLVKTAKNVESIKVTKRVLCPCDYSVRAKAVMAARQLVGGIEIEVVADMKADGHKPPLAADRSNGKMRKKK